MNKHSNQDQILPAKKNPIRILVIRTDRMGDVILSTPVLTALKRTFPTGRVDMLVRPYAHDLVAGHPDLDEIICDDDNGHHKGVQGLLRLSKALREKNFDIALVLHPTFRLAFLAFLARIPIRVGTGYRAYSLLFNKKVYHHRKGSHRHELDLNLEIAESIGARLEQVQFSFNIPTRDKENVAQRYLKRFSGNRPIVVLHPGSGGSARDWPLERFGQLATELVNRLHVKVIVTGVGKEKGLVDKVQEAANVEIFRLDGLLTTKELAAVLQAADLVVANSTGPLHLAVAVGTDVIGLFCPIKPCLPDRWGPYKPGTRTWQRDSVIMPSAPECERCIGESCKYWDCMEAIPVSQVFELAEKKLTAR